MSNPDGVARQCTLPHGDFDSAWDSIMLAEGTRERLLAQSLLSFTVRQKLPFEAAPLHGLILLTGAPGTGKTTLARGLANQVAKQLKGVQCKYIEIDPHALMSSAHGRSQQAVAKLFEHTIPEMAMAGAAIVLLDEVETLAVSRHQLSLDANPIDVHRATDAALAGLDRLTREHRNVLLIATTNFPKALDSAVLSRADHIEEIGLPNLPARREIIIDTLKSIGTVWKKVSTLEADADRLAKAADGLDGRRIRKEIFVAIGSDMPRFFFLTARHRSLIWMLRSRPIPPKTTDCIALGERPLVLTLPRRIQFGQRPASQRGLPHAEVDRQQVWVELWMEKPTADRTCFRASKDRHRQNHARLFLNLLRTDARLSGVICQMTKWCGLGKHSGAGRSVL